MEQELFREYGEGGHMSQDEHEVKQFIRDNEGDHEQINSPLTTNNISTYEHCVSKIDPVTRRSLSQRLYRLSKITEKASQNPLNGYNVDGVDMLTLKMLHTPGAERGGDIQGPYLQNEHYCASQIYGTAKEPHIDPMAYSANEPYPYASSFPVGFGTVDTCMGMKDEHGVGNMPPPASTYQPSINRGHAGKEGVMATSLPCDSGWFKDRNLENTKRVITCSSQAEESTSISKEKPHSTANRFASAKSPKSGKGNSHAKEGKQRVGGGGGEVNMIPFHQVGKKKRTSFTQDQIQKLNAFFSKNLGLSCTPQQINALAKSLDMTEQQVRIYFQNKRARLKQKEKNRIKRLKMLELQRLEQSKR